MSAPGPAPGSARSRPLLGAAALAALPALVLADCAVLAARGWRPLGTGDRLALGAVAAALVAPFALLALRPLRRLLGTRWRQLALLCAGLLLSFGLAELGLARLIPEPGFHLRPAGMRRVHRTDPAVMPGIAGDSRYTVDALGVRGPELPAERSIPRLLCIGGSTTECLYLDDDETWPHMLGERLKAEAPVWVGAIGLAGFSSVHHLKFLEESALVRDGTFDTVVVLVGVNDLWKVYLGVTEEQQLAGDLKPLWARSRLAGVLHGWLDRWRAERSAGLEHWAYHVPQLRRERAAGAKLDQGPDLAPWLDQYQARLERIAAVCRERGLKLVFVSQPVQWAADLPPEIEARFWFGWVEGGGYVTARVLRAGMDAFNQRLAQVAARLDLPLIDLSPMSGDARFFFDDCHFSEAGAREAAARIADRLLEHPDAWR